MVALMFLVAGLLTPASVSRKGPGRFARDRLLRLGVPCAAFFLLLWPALLYALVGGPLTVFGVLGSFAVFWLVTSRVPLLRRVV